MANRIQVQISSGNLTIEFERAVPLESVEWAIEGSRACVPTALLPNMDPAAPEDLKFSDRLPS